jgi:hypothetical protein
MSTTKTRPMRILADDYAPIRLFADLRREDPAQIVHEAMVDFFAKHREDLARLHAETQGFIERGDIEGLAAAMRGDADGVAARLAGRNRRTRAVAAATA